MLTNSALAVLQGSQTPRISSVPPHLTSAGQDAVDYAASVGLVMDPWQSTVLDGALGERGPMWAAFEVGVVVNRQNGKGAILEARELAGIELFGERLILHTAHELKTAAEAHLRMEQICESSPDLSRQVDKVVRTNGKEAIIFKNGARIKYVARSARSGRGFSGDLIVMDEAMFLESESMAALLPTLSTAANPQIWYTGSAGLPDSTHLRSVRERAMAGGDPSLAYFEWSVPADADLDDPKGWAQSNPAMGIRITEEFIRRERAALSDEDFARERLGIWDSRTTAAVIDFAHWLTLADEGNPITDTPMFSIDTTPDRSRTSIGVAGRRADGIQQVEVADNDQGTGWVIDNILKKLNRWPGSHVVLDPSGPAGSFVTDLKAAGIEPILISGREMAQACGKFYDAIAGGEIRHLDDPILNTAIGAARKRNLGDAWAWHRKDMNADISPLVAVTIALFALDLMASKQPKRTGKIW